MCFDLIFRICKAYSILLLLLHMSRFSLSFSLMLFIRVTLHKNTKETIFPALYSNKWNFNVPIFHFMCFCIVRSEFHGLKSVNSMDFNATLTNMTELLTLMKIGENYFFRCCCCFCCLRHSPHPEMLLIVYAFYVWNKLETFLCIQMEFISKLCCDKLMFYVTMFTGMVDERTNFRKMWAKKRKIIVDTDSAVYVDIFDAWSEQQE